MFKKPFSFKGRIRRTEYGISLIIAMLAAGLLVAISEYYRRDFNTQLMIIVIGSIFITYFLIAQGVKRRNDIGVSPWWQAVPCCISFIVRTEGDLSPIHIFTLMFYLYFVSRPGTIGNNKYGEDPKAVVNNRADSFSPPYVSPHNNMPQNDFRYEGGHNGNGISEYNTQQSSQYNHASQQLPYTDSKKVGFQKGDNIYGKKH